MTSSSSPMITTRISNYLFPHNFLIEYLTSIFEENFKVTKWDGFYFIDAPRKLTDDDLDNMKRICSAREREYRSVSPEDDDNRPEEVPSNDLESSIPLIHHSSQGKIVVPAEPLGKRKDIQGCYEISTEFRVDDEESGISGYLYRDPVSTGMTSKVYQSTAICRWYYQSKDSTSSSDSKIIKLAIKKLSANTTLDQLLREYNALRAIKQRYHPNVVEVLSAFRYGDPEGVIHYNLSFPLAAANLKQLLRGLVTNESILASASSLWNQLEGLASGLAYLHDECKIAHADLKPSNILIYNADATPPLVAKIADFGLAVDLQNTKTWTMGTAESRSAWKYDAPEVRARVLTGKSKAGIKLEDSHSIQLKQADIWKLGAVFTELITFLILGSKGVSNFRRFITTTLKNFTSDELSDTRFDDGTKVKEEVLEWIRKLFSRDVRLQELVDIELLFSMLDRADVRPSAVLVSKQLQSVSSCLWSDGTRFVRFVPYNVVLKPTWADKVKARVEHQVGNKVDWWPLSNCNRMLSEKQLRIVWKWCDTELFVDVPEESARLYQKNCKPISLVPAPSILPLHNLNTSGQSQPLQPTNQHGSTSTQGPRVNMPLNSNSPTAGLTDSIAQTDLDTAVSKEVYWCVDKSWSEPRQTQMCSIKTGHQVTDDSSLCQSLIEEYRRVRSLRARVFSWKRCLGIEFIKFSRTIAKENRIVKLGVELPNPDPNCWDYQLTSPELVHMAIAAEQIIYGIYNPSKVANQSSTLLMVPKRAGAPLPLVVGSQGWGIHALQRFSVWKIFYWIAGLTVLGLVFVVLWLVFVSKTDLQNAFIPFTFLAIMMTIGLAIPQILEVD